MLSLYLLAENLSIYRHCIIMSFARGYTDIRVRSVQLPSWMDNFIFNNLGGHFLKSNADMTVIDWNREMILNYLGTYFPRSYTESYCIFKQLLSDSDLFTGRKMISLLDFGCGTGGEIFGFATTICECRPEIDTLRVKAIDGNQYALNRFDDIREEFNKHYPLQILSKPSAVHIEDFYDLSILDLILTDNYDVIMSFKAVCEFVTKQQFEEKNAYEHLSKFMLPRMSNHGIMLLVDVTTRNNVSQEWLPDMMDRGLNAAGARVIARNRGHNETFVVSHSRQLSDTSKIAWRLIGPQIEEF